MPPIRCACEGSFAKPVCDHPGNVAVPSCRAGQEHGTYPLHGRSDLSFSVFLSMEQKS